MDGKELYGSLTAHVAALMMRNDELHNELAQRAMLWVVLLALKR